MRSLNCGVGEKSKVSLVVSDPLFYSRKFIVIEFLQISCVGFVFGILGF